MRPAGIPADIGALFKFTTNKSFGAILLTTNPVVREAIFGERVFKTWCKDNAETILTSWPDVIDKGLVIVTSIYKTARADLTSWQDQEKEVKVGFRPSASEVGELAAASEWYTASGDSGWNTYQSPNVSHIARCIIWY